MSTSHPSTPGRGYRRRRLRAVPVGHAPMLPQALYMMEAWGFEFKSSFVWVKPRAGTGYWTRNRHELLLLGTRGTVPCPAPGTQWDSVIEAASGRQHSEKPEAAYELIESSFPNLPKLELNARKRRPGWDVWGLEAPEVEDSDDRRRPEFDAEAQP